ncbi:MULTISPECIES: NUDIX domain-containing protein [unclassified Rhizobium]|uniref:NUDIX domain-containing protein n=1 Tax=unclassified Rhizobium TaxID=2613769 RepID=UPI001ADCD49E|nr:MULTISPECIES: NUDIX domain-containing protein [unclassified Rhizobium]MBO9127040.1 NUDIX domain-containing protein [Rhizobium sp. 16-488-2b]MBO9177487.1 NUDIX domain-containing protein [Rhizobium sp. 16-488-2a]
MSARSAGLLLFRRTSDVVEVLLVHPGGPFWAKKDEGAWSIPKGLVESGESDFDAAVRETREELGVDVDGEFVALGEYRQPSGKTVVAWCVEANPLLDMDDIKSETFTMEWPPKSGQQKSFPEVDRAGWFSMEVAGVKMLKGQRPMLEALQRHLG